MSLSSALEIARSGLAVTAGETAVVSRNVARAGDPSATRKLANVVTGPSGGVLLASITRVSNEAVFGKVLAANAAASGQQAISAALDILDQTVNDPELDASPAALIGKLGDALQQYAASPNDAIAGQAVVTAAADLANALNEATETVQQVRRQADEDIASAVNNLNTLLGQFEEVNRAIVTGTRAGADVTDYLDQRDAILKSISEEVGIKTVSRADNDMAIYTDSGVTLFETRARTVTFQPAAGLAPGVAGNAVYADGVPITGGGAMAVNSGRIAALATVRDDITVTYQRQLDEIARGLIEVFAESDQSATPTLPDAAGLFTYSGAPAVPPSGAAVNGLAGDIRVNASADPAQGGDPARLRDGGLAGTAYVYNSTGAAGFTDRLQELTDKLSKARPFDPAAQVDTSATLPGFASSSTAWLEEARKSAAAEAEYRNTLFERSSEALSEASGVNLDDEMAKLLDLERAYQASSKLISTIDSMYSALLAATG